MSSRGRTGDGPGTEIYYLCDGLGSVSEITDDSGVVTDTTTYDVFGGVRSSTGSTENVWLFTGEQSDGALCIEAILPEALDTVVSSSNLTGATVANLDEDPDAGDANWATATALGNTEVRTGFATPSDDPVTGADLQEFRVLLRKDAAAGTDPTYSIELWETGGGSALATLASGVTLTSEVGSVVSVTWDASLLGTADGSAVELRIIGTASADRSVEVGAVEWEARVPGTGAELYFLRARYYDPATGRFIGRDPIEFAQRYAYAGNNPVAFTDPAGLCVFGVQCPDYREIVGAVGGCLNLDLSCGESADRLSKAASDSVSDAARGATGGAIDLAAIGPYGLYYVSYELLGSEVGQSLPHPVQAGLVGTQALGLAGDVSLDWLKIQLVEGNQNGIWDEGYVGSVCPDPVEELFGRACPRTYLPGLHRTENVEGGYDNHIDFRGVNFGWPW